MIQIALFCCPDILSTHWLRQNVNEYGGMVEVALDPHKNKTGDIWHVCVEVVTSRHIENK